METSIAIIGLGACGVFVVGELLLRLPRIDRWRTGLRLATAHTLVVLAFLAAAPLYIEANWGSPYGDLYAPYFLVPGVHIYYVTAVTVTGTLFRSLLDYMEPFPASVISVIVVPGLIGLVVGGLQWWVIGAMWDRFAPTAACESKSTAVEE